MGRTVRTNWAYWLAGIGLVTAAAIGALTYVLSRARVTGATPEERITSIYRIAADRPPGAADALADAFASDREPAVRQTALAGLIQIAAPHYREIVEKGLTDDSAEVRQVAAGGLARYADSRAAGLLAGMIREDSSRKVRLAAVGALAQCDDPRSIVVLLGLAERPGHREERLHAMRSLLGRLHANLGPSHRPENVPAWRDLIQRLKRMTLVREAHASLSAPLVDRPQDVLGVDHHPERRRGPGKSPAE